MIVPTSNGRFNVEQTGNDGTPMVLLHPLALAGSAWDPMARHLAGAHRVFAPDARGHGDSEWDGDPFTVEDLAADTAAIVEALDLGPVDVVGMSMGGCTAMVLAASRPDLVRRLVLADTTACYGPDRVEQWSQRASQAENTPREEQLTFQRRRWFSERFREEHPDEVERVAKIFVATDSRAHAAACHALGGVDITARLADIRAGTLVVAGDEDYATPPAMAADITDGIAGSRLRILENTRHLSLLERPDLWPAIAEHVAG
jgi:3-oxoadipate enol-lactonase